MPPVSPERYRQIKSVLQAALELEPAGQAAFLEQACGNDAELKAEVRSLLDHDRESEGFLEKPAVETTGAAFRLKPGSRLGPYEIVEPIGAGAMGEVYRAHDPRFGRDVAIKLLPAAFATDEGRLARFEREARAAGSLNHPNVLTVHDFGREEGMPYLVSELLRGETLRERLKNSAIAPATAVTYAAQIARGLEAAHALGIVHRDVKPENVFLAQAGLVKILDFGVARMPDLPGTGRDAAPGGATEPGMVLGTVGYMSPEQVRGEPAGPRSDIFSLGVVLYEMLAGTRPFAGATWVDETNAILRKEAPDLPRDLAGIPDPAALNRILPRCLAKRAENRFESARDLAFALESILERARPKPARSRLRRAPIGTAVAAILAIVAFFAISRLRTASPAAPQALTFRHGIVSAARFTADGRTVVYSAAWDRESFRLYSTRPDGPENPLALQNAMLLAVSSRDDLALCIPASQTQHRVIGKLALATLSGGGLPVRAEGVSAADWSPDGSELAVVRVENERSQIEYPIGRVLYRSPSAGYIESLRVSPGGDAIAFLEHPLTDDSAGWVAMIDRDGRNYRAVSRRFNSMRGLAWSPDGGEAWFAAARQGTNMAVWAVSRWGRERNVQSYPDYLSVEDIWRDRRVLLSFHHLLESMVHVAAEGGSTDLSWQDQSQVQDVSRDGAWILFSESGGATRQDYDAYLRKADASSPAVHLGVGLPLSLSADGQWAIANPAGSPAPLTLLPTVPGKPRTLAADGIHHVGAAWLPDGESFVFAGIRPGENLRYYVQSLQGGTPRPITGGDVLYERRSPIVVSRDGRFVAAVDTGKHVAIYSTAAGQPDIAPGHVPNLEPGFTPLQWCPDGRLALHRYDEPAPQLWLADPRTGNPTPWKKLLPPNPVGLLDITPIRVSPDCQSYTYSPLNVLSQVYLAAGLR